MPNKEYTITGEKTIIPNLLYATVYKPDGDYLGMSLITLDQWNDKKFMDRIIKDMETMVASGIEMAFIDDSVRGGNHDT